MKRFRSAYLLLILLGAGCGQSPEPVANAEPPTEQAVDETKTLWTLIEDRSGACARHALNQQAIKDGIEKAGQQMGAHLATITHADLRDSAMQSARSKLETFNNEMEAKSKAIRSEYLADLAEIDRKIIAEMERLSR